MSGVMRPQEKPGAMDQAMGYWGMVQQVKGGFSANDKRDAMERRKSQVMNPADQQQKGGGLPGMGG